MYSHAMFIIVIIIYQSILYMFDLLPIELCKLILSKVSYHDYLRICKAYPVCDYLTETEKIEYYNEYALLKEKERKTYEMVDAVQKNNNLMFVKNVIKSMTYSEDILIRNRSQEMHNICNLCNMPRYYHIAYNILEEHKQEETIRYIIVINNIHPTETCPLIWDMQYHMRVMGKDPNICNGLPLTPPNYIYDIFSCMM